MVLFVLLALWILAITAAVLLLLFVIQMLVDAAQHQFSNTNQKTVWIAIIALTFGIGALVYYFSERKKAV